MMRGPVLGLHLMSDGFGWALFEEPTSLFDWGTADIRGSDNAKTLLRAGGLFDRYEPGVLVIEEFEHGPRQRAPRIAILYRAIIARAELRNMTVQRIDRESVRHVFHPARTRHATATVVAERFPELSPHLPRKRKIWERERLRISIFSAAACAITYFSHAATQPLATSRP